MTFTYGTQNKVGFFLPTSGPDRAIDFCKLLLKISASAMKLIFDF